MSLERQHYAQLPDGKLRDYEKPLERNIAAIVLEHEIEAIYSFGELGFDGHDDHAATFRPASAVARALGLPHIARSDDREGDLVFTGDPQIKHGIMRWHESQYDPEDPEFWPSFTQYINQFSREVYQISPSERGVPAAHDALGDFAYEGGDQ